MHHIAIMKKSWGLLPKILNEQKTIESRWYMNKYPPWEKIKPNEIVYFKDSSEPVTIKADIEKIIQFDNLNPKKVRNILEKYGKADGLVIHDIPRFYQLFKKKKYCILIFLKNPQSVKSFDINKKGFGAMAAWMIVDDIEKIKKI